MAETSYLPPDIIQIILSKLLSVKALLRFKSVSKTWNSIISDPQFVKNHHHQSKSSNPQDLFICHSPISDSFSLVKLEEQKLETVQVLPSPYNCSFILCRYEGVLLLSDNHNIRILWNPKSRTQKKIWIPFSRGSNYGLCPDPTTDGFGFKVVIVNKDNYSVCSVNKNNKSLITKRKKSDGLYTDYGPSICNHTPVCVDGAVYWVWSRENVDEIIYYDPRDDQFKVLQKPQYVDLEGKRIYMVDLGGSLCLRCQGRDTTTIKMWIKEKGIGNDSWKDLMTIENVVMGVWSFEPQCLLGDKILIWNRTSVMNLVAYSPLEKMFEQIGDKMFPRYKYETFRYGLFRYLDSPLSKWRGV